MALTKAQAALLSNDLLLRGIIQTIVKESPVLTMLPFMEVSGNAVTYNREATMPAAVFYDVGDTWAEAVPTFTQHTAKLTIIGGDADVDNFLQATYSDTNDLTAEVIASRAKAVAHQFTDTFYNGTVAGNAKSFDGIHTIIPAGQTLSMGANGAALTLAKIDELIDKVIGKPDAMLMSKRTRRKLKDLRRTSGIILETEINEFGQQISYYDGIPLLVDDFVSDVQVMGTSGAVCSSIYAVKFGMGAGLMGLENGGIVHEVIGSLETKDAARHRIKWYSGLANYNELGTAKLTGILP